MEIVKLQIKNFLSISDVEIKPGQINQIIGKNNQGKTSILKAIEFAVKGASDGSLVKFGEESAEVIVELADQTTIRRKLSAEGKQSVSVKKDGFSAPTPQTYLDALFEHSAFNPLDLLDAKKRNDAILSSIDIKVDEPRLRGLLGSQTMTLPPLDYSLHGLKLVDQAHKYFYQRRAEANKDAEEKKKRWETYQADLPPAIETSLTRESIQGEVDGINSKINQAKSELEFIRAENEQCKQACDRHQKYQDAVAEIDKQIAEAEASLQALHARKEEGFKFVEKAKAEIPEKIQDPNPVVKRLSDLEVEAATVRAKFSELEKIQSVSKQKEMVEQMKSSYDQAQTVADDLTDYVTLLGGQIKVKLMSEAEMPIAGLEYRDGAFLVEGTPVDNLSSSKALKLAMGVAKKLAKKTKLICVDGAELLDTDTYKALLEEVKNDGFTYFVTSVGERCHPDHTVIHMSEGKVVP